MKLQQVTNSKMKSNHTVKSISYEIDSNFINKSYIVHLESILENRCFCYWSVIYAKSKTFIK